MSTGKVNRNIRSSKRIARDHKEATSSSFPTPKTSQKFLFPRQVSSKMDDGTIIIAADGDTILHIKDPVFHLDQRYRCSRSVLRAESDYFDRLLDPSRWKEGIALEDKLQQLLNDSPDQASPSLSELPEILLSEIGVHAQDSSTSQMATELFLNLLHHRGRSTPSTAWPVSRSESIRLAVQLALIAEFFLAMDCIKEYLKLLDWSSALPTSDANTPGDLMELQNRQALLVGLMLDDPKVVKICSANLITDGSKTWTGQYSESDDAATDLEPPWSPLPRGIEEELECRRECVLETIGSIQTHFINLYTSKDQQCTLGYGNSKQCDSFQLGETIRYLQKRDLLGFYCKFAPSRENPPFVGNLAQILSDLRGFTPYQIDTSHAHCGLRSRLIPILGAFSPRRQVSICLACWNKDREKESWRQNPRNCKWALPKNPMVRPKSCQDHEAIKAMFTASERDWTPSPA